MAMTPGKAERDSLWRLVEMARQEDLGSGDVTGSIVPLETRARAQFIARESLVVCGAALLEAVAMCYDGEVRTVVHAEEGLRVQPGALLADWEGPCRGILAAERVALNFLQRLSGVATATRAFVDAVAGTGAEIYDTRKTTPGWRDLEKYAVRAGGGKNHRRGLYDAVLIKDNHLAVLAKAEGLHPIEAAGRELERLRPMLADGAFIELEVDTLDQFEHALALSVDIILLDNMHVDQIRRAVARRSEAGLAGRVLLEASGGITLANVRQVAETGVERIAVGAITHSAEAMDIALDIEPDRA
jgi:nicotinate-nucleotide pyrophosphorylase (carboxylating)